MEVNKYVVVCSNSEEATEVISSIENSVGKKWLNWAYLIVNENESKVEGIYDKLPTVYNHLAKIDYKTWKSNRMKNEVGYICPMDLFNGRIKKGDIFSEYGEELLVMYNKNHMTLGVATEIVHTWEKAKLLKEVHSGDWVVITKSKINWCDAMDKYVGACVQVIETRSDKNTYISFLGDRGFSWILEQGHFRLAESDEIRGALKAPIITINGYKSLFLKDRVLFGCATIFVDDLKAMETVLLEWNKNKQSNKSISGIKIGEGYFSLSSIKSILKYYGDKQL